MSGQKKRRKNCLCCAENIVESIQSKKSKYPFLGESNTIPYRARNYNSADSNRKMLSFNTFFLIRVGTFILARSYKL